MKEMGITLIVTGAVLGAMGGIFGGHTALVVGIIMIMAGQMFFGGAKSAPAVVSTGLALAFVLALSGCAAPHTRLVEMPRSEVVGNPQVRAGAPYIFSNRYSATNADVRLYEGQLQKSDMIGNVGGRPVIFSDYVAKFNLDNAFGSNDPTVQGVMLDPKKRYTALVVVNWGAFGKIYDIYSVSLYPTADSIRTVWTSPRGWDSAYVNDYVEVTGSNEPAYSRLDLTWTVYPNEIFRRALVGGAR